jgi:CelD/BcsL family acetyltransferase involved in cellulose biosynthesis
MHETLQSEILRGEEAVSTLAKDWDELFERASGAPPYLSRAWLSTFISEGRLRGTPLFIEVRCGEKLVALLVLAIRHFFGVRIAEPIGTGYPSYLGILVDPAYLRAIECMVDAFLKREVASVLYNNDLYSRDVATLSLLDVLTKKGFLCLRVERNPCHRIRLECSYEEYLTTTKNSFERRRLRRNERRISEIGEVEVEHHIGREITSGIIERVASIQQASWMKRRGANVFIQPFYRKLLTEMGGAGLCHVWLLKINASDVAFAVAFVAHKILYYEWIAFDLKYESPKIAVGQLLTGRVIQYACSNGLAYFDFSHGDARYKRFWSNECHVVYRAVTGRGFLGRFLSICYFILGWLATKQWLHTPYRRVRRYYTALIGR